MQTHLPSEQSAAPPAVQWPAALQPSDCVPVAFDFLRAVKEGCSPAVSAVAALPTARRALDFRHRVERSRSHALAGAA